MENLARRINLLVARISYCMAMSCLLLLWICGNSAGAAQALHPLAPPDTSSPRATLKTFLDTTNKAIRAYKAGHRDEALALAHRAARCLNLEKEPPALRDIAALYATLYLKETLDRVEIPPDDKIPDAEAVRTEKISSWTIPYTEITIARLTDGSSVDRFLFTSSTVRNAEEYYNKVRNLPYTSQSEGGGILDQLRTSGSVLVSQTLIDRLPGWTRTVIYGQMGWQWIGLALYFCLAGGMILLLYKCGNAGLGILDEKFGLSLKFGLGGLILPLALIVFSRIGLWFIVYGLRILDADIYLPIAYMFLIISYLGRIWLLAAVLNRIAAIVVWLGGIVHGGVDDQLVRLGFQALSVIIIGLMIINLGARLGLPTYSFLTGLGIGGIAVALAGREALSNIIGTIMIVLDRPFKLGDYIVLGEGERGEVAEVGLRSTRIKTRDDILISIPNSVIANAKMINQSAPMSMCRIRIKVGVAYGSDLKKAEQILLAIAEQNETVLPDPVPRIRFRSFGDSALNLELLCWIDPPNLQGQVTHELNWAINEEFRKHGIEIPFAQRDIHIRTST